MNQTTTLQQMQAIPQAQQKPNHPVAMSFFDLQGFELMQRIAKAFSTSDLVPKQYQGNLPNCMIALDMAQRIGANPLMVMQNLYVVHGTPGWSSKFLIATVNTCGRYSTLRYEWRGKPGDDNYGCRAWAIEKDTNERLEGIWVDWKMVNAEGWAAKSGSKWKTMPDQMFIYRSAAFWQRAYAPDLGMGLQTEEELRDTFDAKRDASGSYSVDLDTLRQPPSEHVSEQESATLAHNPDEHINTLTGEIIRAQEAEPEPVQQRERATRAKPQAQQQSQQQADLADDLSME